MGNAGRHHAPPYLPLPKPTAPMPVAREVAIPAGGTATATWNLRGGYGAEIEIKNTGSSPCEFAGHRLRAGKTAVVSVLDRTREFALEIDSAEGTRVRLTVIACRPARRVLALKKEVLRDPTTKLITGIVQIPCWVEEAP